MPAGPHASNSRAQGPLLTSVLHSLLSGAVKPWNEAVCRPVKSAMPVLDRTRPGPPQQSTVFNLNLL